MENTFALKRALRKQIATTLKQLDQAEINRQSELVRQSIKKQGLLTHARGVCCYLSMGSGELSTSDLVNDILAADIPLYVPVIPSPTAKPKSQDKYAPPAPEHDMRMKRLYSRLDFEKCPKDKWGIPDAGSHRHDVDEDQKAVREDAEDEGAPPLDVILVPGMAFDRSRGRLGHGKGYYDRYTQRYKESAKEKGNESPILVALALSEQLVPERVPCTPDDQLVDSVVLSDEVIDGK